MERTSDYGVSVVQARCGEEPETKGAHNLRRFHELYGTPIGDEGVSRTIVMFIQVVIKILYIHFHFEIYMIDVIFFFVPLRKLKSFGTQTLSSHQVLYVNPVYLLYVGDFHADHDLARECSIFLYDKRR